MGQTLAPGGLVTAGRPAEIARFLETAAWADAQRQPLGADWSNRRYERLRRAGGSAVLMDAAADSPVDAFLAVDRWLRAIGLHAPLILAADISAGLLLLEDLGDDLVAGAVARGADELSIYTLALDVILRFQDAPPPGFVPRLDDLGLVELLDLFLEFEANGLGETEHERFRSLWHAALPEARLGADVFLYRDYHAENMLWLPGEQGLWRLGLIDFQDAFQGPRAYDLVSLLQDARRDVTPATAEAITERYLAAQPGLSRDRLDTALAILGAQRAMRILGVLGRLVRVRGRTMPAGIRPRVIGHLRRSLQHPAMAELRRWCGRHTALLDGSMLDATG